MWNICVQCRRVILPHVLWWLLLKQQNTSEDVFWTLRCLVSSAHVEYNIVAQAIAQKYNRQHAFRMLKLSQTWHDLGISVLVGLKDTRREVGYIFVQELIGLLKLAQLTIISHFCLLVDICWCIYAAYIDAYQKQAHLVAFYFVL